MKKFIIPIQNVSDVITNSSSEIFVCKSNNPEETVALLREVLESVYENYKKARKHANGEDVPFYGETIDELMTIDISDKEYTEKYWGYTVHEGDVVIESTSDNSIPEILMNFIHEFFQWGDVERRHLG